MIKTENLQKIFRTEEVETWALAEVNIEINEGEFVDIIGHAGSGKTTVLNNLGLLAIAIAIITRCRCPPDNSNG